ncbi:MAG TPA: OsmC family protein [Armatimonadota bacterium]|jgi:uncharacterized OsmC-like protein
MARWTSKSVNVGPTFFAGEIRGHQLYGDVPMPLGGHDLAMIPPEGLLVVLGNCLGMEIALACKNKGVDYMGMSIEVEAEWDEKEHFLHDFTLKVNMPADLDARAQRTVEAGVKMCTIRNTLMRGAQVDLTVTH